VGCPFGLASIDIQHALGELTPSAEHNRVLFANDYPFVDSKRVPEFLRALGDVIGPSDMRKVCQTNAEELFKIKA
jgi:predicted TIM-barrel fold metal-dependent hydrolase